MLLLTVVGFIANINFTCVTYDMFWNYLVIFSQRINNYNHQVTLLRSISKVKYRTGFYHYQKDCIICWDVFRNKEYVSILNCHNQHFFHTKCIKDWIRKGNNSCPLCRQSINDEQRSVIDNLKYQCCRLFRKVKYLVSRNDEGFATDIT